MGDMAKRNIIKKSMEEKIAEREARKQETVHTENQTIDKIATKPKSRDMTISARVNGETYAKFKDICEARGLTRNGCINMLIADFVIANKALLEDE